MPLKSSFLGAGADRFGFPFGNLGTPLAGIFNHCPDATETHTNAMVGRIILSILLIRETGALGLRQPNGRSTIWREGRCGQSNAPIMVDSGLFSGPLLTANGQRYWTAAPGRPELSTMLPGDRNNISCCWFETCFTSYAEL